MALTTENHSRGLLVDDELIAGVTESSEAPGSYAAYVLRHTTGEYLGYRDGLSLDEALALINEIPRGWSFEAAGGCDGSRCAEGKCKGEGCKAFDKNAAAVRMSSAVHSCE